MLVLYLTVMQEAVKEGLKNAILENLKSETAK